MNSFDRSPPTTRRRKGAMVESLELQDFQIYLLEGQKHCYISLERLFQTFGTSQEVVFPHLWPTDDLKAAFLKVECHGLLGFPYSGELCVCSTAVFKLPNSHSCGWYSIRCASRTFRT